MLYIKALHIIFIVTWFAGLFYTVRLFVYHSEANLLPEPEKSILIKHFKGATKRLWYGITWPSAVATITFGVWLLIKLYLSAIPDWLWLKIGFVILLIAYQLFCQKIFNQLQKDIIKYSGMQMRVMNETATLFLVAIVFIVELKSLTNWVYGLAGLVLFAIVLMLAINMYRKARLRNKKY